MGVGAAVGFGGALGPMVGAFNIYGGADAFAIHVGKAPLGAEDGGLGGHLDPGEGLFGVGFEATFAVVEAVAVSEGSGGEGL